MLPHKDTEFGKAVEAWRKECLRNNNLIQVHDFGAGYGGKVVPHLEKTISGIAKSSARGRREGELLGRICQHYQRKTALELGTNLGFSAPYIANALQNEGKLHTIEGAPQIANFAVQTFSRFDLKVAQIVGEFEQAFQQIDWAHFQPDFVLLDGNHQEKATLDYFQFLLPKLAKGAIVVLDDIYWSKGMQNAWKQIQAMPEVRLSIDLYAMGIVFLDRDQAKQDFSFRFRAW